MVIAVHSSKNPLYTFSSNDYTQFTLRFSSRPFSQQIQQMLWASKYIVDLSLFGRRFHAFRCRSTDFLSVHDDLSHTRNFFDFQ